MRVGDIAKVLQMECPLATLRAQVVEVHCGSERNLFSFYISHDPTRMSRGNKPANVLYHGRRKHVLATRGVGRNLSVSEHREKLGSFLKNNPSY